MDLDVSPLGQVEGDLDVRVTITDGVVTDAWTEAAMFRGFEIILRGKDPQAGLIVTPAHLRHLRRQPPVQGRVRARHRVGDARAAERHADAQHRAGSETLQSIPRYFYAIVRDRPDEQAATRSRRSYDEAVRRFAPVRRHQLPDRA